MGAILAAINAFVKIKHFIRIISKFVRCHFFTLYYKRAYKALPKAQLMRVKINRKLVKLLRFIFAIELFSNHVANMFRNQIKALKGKRLYVARLCKGVAPEYSA